MEFTSGLNRCVDAEGGVKKPKAVKKKNAAEVG
jgi:hypothetical protein